MQFAVNYSAPLLELVREGKLHVDLYKCPGWHDLIDEIETHGGVHIHFPLLTGRDMDNALNGETHAPADLDAIEALLARSDSNLVNIHFAPNLGVFPEIPWESTDPAHIDLIVESALRSITALTDRFGDRVIVENVPDAGRVQHKICTLPAVITRVIEESGAYLLLDTAHATLAADDLGIDVKDYINALPTHRVKEVHVTGVQIVEQVFLDRLNELGYPNTMFHRFLGKQMDHLPITDRDWEILDWVFEEIHSGAWAMPELVSLEYGGSGGWWGVLAEKDILAEQVPRLHKLVKGQVQPI